MSQLVVKNMSPALDKSTRITEVDLFCGAESGEADQKLVPTFG